MMLRYFNYRIIFFIICSLSCDHCKIYIQCKRFIFQKKELQPKYSILPPNLNNYWMTAVIGWSIRVTDLATLIGRGIIPYLDFMFQHKWNREEMHQCWMKVTIKWYNEFSPSPCTVLYPGVAQSTADRSAAVLHRELHRYDRSGKVNKYSNSHNWNHNNSFCLLWSFSIL